MQPGAAGEALPALLWWWSFALPLSVWCLIRCPAPLHTPAGLSIYSQRCSFPSATSSLESGLGHPPQWLHGSWPTVPTLHTLSPWGATSSLPATLESRSSHSHQLVSSYFTGHLVTLTVSALWPQRSHALIFPDWSVLHIPCFSLKEGYSHSFDLACGLNWKAIAAQPSTARKIYPFLLSPASTTSEGFLVCLFVLLFFLQYCFLSVSHTGLCWLRFLEDHL